MDEQLLLGDLREAPAQLPPDWREFWERCKTCTDCPLAETRQNVVVFRGGIDAPLLILGEGPGREEDERGIPFCGRSGRLLDAALQSLEFKERDIHIANMVKCRPPGNRVPNPDELAACRHHLREQFKLLNPKIILVMGNTAFQNFTGQKTGITRARGKWLEDKDFLVLPTFHPAYVLRDPRRKPDLYHDLLTCRNKLVELGYLDPLAQPFEF